MNLNKKLEKTKIDDAINDIKENKNVLKVLALEHWREPKTIDEIISDLHKDMRIDMNFETEFILRVNVIYPLEGNRLIKCVGIEKSNDINPKINSIFQNTNYIPENHETLLRINTSKT